MCIYTSVVALRNWRDDKLRKMPIALECFNLIDSQTLKFIGKDVSDVVMRHVTYLLAKLKT